MARHSLIPRPPLACSMLREGAWLTPRPPLACSMLREGAWLTPRPPLACSMLREGAWLTPRPPLACSMLREGAWLGIASYPGLPWLARGCMDEVSTDVHAHWVASQWCVCIWTRYRR